MLYTLIALCVFLGSILLYFLFYFILFVYFNFILCYKGIIFFHLAIAQDRDPGWLKWSLVVGERDLCRSHDTREIRGACQRLLGSEGSWLCPWRTPSLEAGQHIRSLLIFLMSFTSSFRQWLSRKSQRRSLWWQNPVHADPKGPGSCSSSGPWWLQWHPGYCLTHLGIASSHPGREHSFYTSFASSRDA